MPLDPEALLGAPVLETASDQSRRDTILYALGVAAGQDAERLPGEMRLLDEKNLVALPTMAVVLAYPTNWLLNPDYDLPWRTGVFVGQSLTLHAPLPVEGRFRSTMRIAGVVDKGPRVGSLVMTARDLFDADGNLLASMLQTTLFRGESGGGSAGRGPPEVAPLPDRAADHSVRLTVRPDQAFHYRLTGDMNRLHIDAGAASRAGFQAPPLHGLCLFGMAARLAMVDGLASEPITHIAARLGPPVYPGATIEFRYWKDTRGVRFAVRSASTDDRPSMIGTIGFS